MRAAVLALMAALALAGCGRKGALVRQGPPPPAAAVEPIKPTVVDPERREDWTLEEEGS
ncbi:LPS translocon maturation chaperone LptM [Neomegalonema perideroedes]|uniref:LPS translocon maturation chaperone LptM n=1 Tax=Neomegalonema perideroedes TaxID=217219 RepID=UPI0003820FBF|nr:lipoprotein [Neomegalonema perideroedes]